MFTKLRNDRRRFMRILAHAPSDLVPRRRSKKLLLGVCAGISAGYQLPQPLVRGLFVVLSFPFGLGIIAYYIIALISPVED